MLPRTLGSRTYALMGNVVLATPRSLESLRPAAVLSGGLGLIHASAEDQLDLLAYRLNLLGLNVGGGAVGFLSDRVGLRFDLRYFRNISGVPEEDLEPAHARRAAPAPLLDAAFGVVIKK